MTQDSAVTRVLGITVLADFILNEGIDGILDNLTRRVGATAVAVIEPDDRVWPGRSRRTSRRVIGTKRRWLLQYAPPMLRFTASISITWVAWVNRRRTSDGNRRVVRFSWLGSVMGSIPIGPRIAQARGAVNAV